MICAQVDAVTAAHNRCWNVIMDGIVKHGSEKRDVKPITCGKEKTFRTVWREADLEEAQVFPQEQVEKEERRRWQARKAREEEARQEEKEGREEHEEEEVGMG